jgi:hypothetical protein
MTCKKIVIYRLTSSVSALCWKRKLMWLYFILFLVSACLPAYLPQSSLCRINSNVHHIAVGDIIETLRHADQRVTAPCRHERSLEVTEGYAGSARGFPYEYARRAHETYRPTDRHASFELLKLIDTNDALEPNVRGLSFVSMSTSIGSSFCMSKYVLFTWWCR